MSEVFIFTYGDPLDPVDGISGKSTSSREAEFKWDSKTSQNRYTFRYRVAGSEQWNEKELVLTNLKLTNLSANTDYEYQVRAIYGAMEGPWSSTHRVKTLLESYESNFTCGATPASWSLSNTELISSLVAGDTIFVSDFAIVLVDVTGGDGIFSGKGMIEIPFLNQHLKTNQTDPKVKLLVQFDNINVNTARRMIAGEVKVTSGGVQITSDYYARTISDAVTKVEVVLADLEEIATMIEDIEETMAEFLGDEEVQIDESAYANYSPLELVEEAKKLVKEAEEAVKRKDPDAVKNLKKGLALMKKALQLMDEFKTTGEYAGDLLVVIVEIMNENAELYATKAESVKKLIEGVASSLGMDESEEELDAVVINEEFFIEVPQADLSAQEKSSLEAERLFKDAFDFIIMNRTIFLTLKYYTTGDNYSVFLQDFLHQIDGVYKEYRKVKQNGSEGEVHSFLKTKLVAILENYVVEAEKNK
nr:fibronectin type III domain-containing protein [Chryseosolibacter indicus]